MIPILVCIHGWGGSKESFNLLREALKDTDVQILAPDLPGFGQEPDPVRPWTNDDYADWVERWMQGQGLGQGQEFQLLGHSHGGRIAIKIAWRQSTNKLANHQTSKPVNHLYLCAAAGIPHPPTIKETFGLIGAKIGGAVLAIPGLRWIQPIARKILYKLLGVHDYERASPIMKETLKLVTDDDLTPLLRSIDIPTDIFWGTADTMTPYSDALVMKQEIPGSTLHTFDGERHRIHKDKAKEIAAVIRGRIQS